MKMHYEISELPEETSSLDSGRRDFLNGSLRSREPHPVGQAHLVLHKTSFAEQRCVTGHIDRAAGAPAFVTFQFKGDRPMKLLALALATSALLGAQEAPSQQAQSMNVRLIINGAPVPATLYDNAAARDLFKLLPLALIFQDYASAEKIAYPPRKLATTGAPAGFDPSAGDITYYAPWGNLAIFYRDQPYAKELVSLGRIDSGADALNVSGSLKITIEARN